MAIPTATLAGEKVRLRPFSDDDVPLLHKWFNDPEVLQWHHLSEDPPQVMRSLRAHRERWERIRDDPGHVSWVIETKGGTPIGEIGLLNIHPHGRAELGISIGEKDCWSRGYGADAIRALLRHAFGELGLRRVHLIADEDNARAIRCYEKCGFVREGLLRGHRLRHGKPLNMVIMGALAEDACP
ncbi:MAG: GNAT family protein [Dehalococcoidia bacterium]|nr:GNAT family protein [Dehalococcoidia bacterium]